MVSIDTGMKAVRGGMQAVEEQDIFVSTRVRLARNISGCFFPQWANDKQRVEVRDLILSAITRTLQMKDGVVIRMDELSELDRDTLIEEHLVSREFASGSAGRALFLSRARNVSVMVNEEDHIRMQYIDAGVRVDEGWSLLSEIDSALEASLNYAFSEKYGYLTACPTNVGTGLRVSVMMHLPGLNLTGEIEQTIKGLSRIGLQARGLLGEGSEAYGNMYQISNRTTLGISENAIIAKVERIIKDIADHERNARARMMIRKRVLVADRVARSFAVLKHCRMITTGESLGYLSGLRLGIECGMIKGISAKKLNDLLLSIQPAHLQRMHGSAVSEEGRDELRAEMLRKKLRAVRFAD